MPGRRGSRRHMTKVRLRRQPRCCTIGVECFFDTGWEMAQALVAERHRGDRRRAVARRSRYALLLALLLGFVAPGVRAQDLPPQANEIRVLLRSQKLDDAVARGEAWTKASPKDPLAWQWLGRAYSQQALKASLFSKPSWASKVQDAFERSVALDGGNIEARFDLMQFYMVAPKLMGGGTEKARAQAEAIGGIDPARGHVALGLMAERDEDPKTAEREYRAAIARAPDEPRARVALANLLSGQKRWSEARAVFTEQLARKPDDARSLYQLGKLAALSGEELTLGLESIDRYLAHSERPDELPESAAHWRRALVLEKMGRKDEALAALRKSVELDPKAEAPRKDLKRLGG